MMHTHSQRAAGLLVAGLAPETKQMFDELVSSHKVLVFIKGTKQFPQVRQVGRTPPGPYSGHP